MAPTRSCSCPDEMLDAIISWATGLSPLRAWAITAFSVAAATTASALCGPAIWFGPVYLLIICLPAWVLGRSAGLLVGLCCAVVQILSHGMTIYPAGGLAIAWNLAMRISSVGIIVLLVSGFRRSYDRERARARCDGLTGALTRDAFFETAAAARQRGRWGVLAYADLDGFKQVNDCFGHAIGDEVLKAFAETARRSIRSGDVFGRIGGDEFVIYLDIRNEHEGKALIRRLHARLNGIADDMTHQIACSMGALILDPDHGSLTEADVDRADRLMYDAKAMGAALTIGTNGDLPSHRQGHVPARRPSRPRSAAGPAVVQVA